MELHPVNIFWLCLSFFHPEPSLVILAWITLTILSELFGVMEKTSESTLTINFMFTTHEQTIEILCKACIKMYCHYYCFLASESKSDFEYLAKMHNSKVHESKVTDLIETLENDLDTKLSYFPPRLKACSMPLSVDKYVQMCHLNSGSLHFLLNPLVYFSTSSTKPPSQLNEKTVGEALTEQAGATNKEDDSVSKETMWKSSEKMQEHSIPEEISSGVFKLEGNAEIHQPSELALVPLNPDKKIRFKAETYKEDEIRQLSGLKNAKSPRPSESNKFISPLIYKRKVGEEEEENSSKRPKNNQVNVKAINQTMELPPEFVLSSGLREMVNNKLQGILRMGNHPSTENEQKITKANLGYGAKENHLNGQLDKGDILLSFDGGNTMALSQEKTKYHPLQQSFSESSSSVVRQHTLGFIENPTEADFVPQNEAEVNETVMNLPFSSSKTTEADDFGKFEPSAERSTPEKPVEKSEQLSLKERFLDYEVGESSMEKVVRDVDYKPYPGPIGIHGFVKKDSRYQKKFYKMRRLIENSNPEENSLNLRYANNAMAGFENMAANEGSAKECFSKRSAKHSSDSSHLALNEWVSEPTTPALLDADSKTHVSGSANDFDNNFTYGEERLYYQGSGDNEKSSNFSQSELKEAVEKSSLLALVNFIAKDDTREPEKDSTIYCRDTFTCMPSFLRNPEGKISMHPFLKIKDLCFHDARLISIEEFLALLLEFQSRYFELSFLCPHSVTNFEDEIYFPQVPMEGSESDSDLEMDLRHSLTDDRTESNINPQYSTVETVKTPPAENLECESVDNDLLEHGGLGSKTEYEKTRNTWKKSDPSEVIQFPNVAEKVEVDRSSSNEAPILNALHCEAEAALPKKHNLKTHEEESKSKVLGIQETQNFCDRFIESCLQDRDDRKYRNTIERRPDIYRSIMNDFFNNLN